MTWIIGAMLVIYLPTAMGNCQDKIATECALEDGCELKAGVCVDSLGGTPPQTGGSAAGGECDGSRRCDTGLMCCNWNNSGGGSTAATGICGEMCTMSDPAPTPTPGSGDCTNVDTAVGDACEIAGKEGKCMSTVVGAGFFCEEEYTYAGIGGECDGGARRCVAGLTCCNWDNGGGGSTAVTGSCGEACITTSEPRECYNNADCPPLADQHCGYDCMDGRCQMWCAGGGQPQPQPQPTTPGVACWSDDDCGAACSCERDHKTHKRTLRHLLFARPGGLCSC